jgi:hypothetical protein
MRSIVGIIIVFVIGSIIGILIYRGVTAKSEQYHQEETAVVLLEKLQKVAKLVTLEANFAELYHYQDYYKWDWAPFRKKAIIRIKAKVSIGIDIEKTEFIADNDAKKIIIKGFPPPEILSIDTDIDYYDLTEGTFNSFSTADLNRLQSRAKLFIRQKALESEFTQQAEEQALELLSVYNSLANIHGWEVEIQGYKNKSLSN